MIIYIYFLVDFVHDKKKKTIKTLLGRVEEGTENNSGEYYIQFLKAASKDNKLFILQEDYSLVNPEMIYPLKVPTPSMNHRFDYVFPKEIPITSANIKDLQF